MKNAYGVNDTACNLLLCHCHRTNLACSVIDTAYILYELFNRPWQPLKVKTIMNIYCTYADYPTQTLQKYVQV
jgi:hypothetical protein